MKKILIAIMLLALSVACLLTACTNLPSGEADKTYTVSIVSNNTDYGTVDRASVTVTADSKVEVRGKSVVVDGTYITAKPTASNAQYTYSFDGFTVGSKTVEADMTVTANFSRTENKYTVKVASNDASYGRVSETEVANVPYGTSVSAEGNVLHINGTTITATPASDTEKYSYEFKSWTNGFATVDGDFIVTANFTRTEKKYTVKWVDEDGTLLKEDTNVACGAYPYFSGDLPTKEGNAQYTYTFNSWSPAIKTVTEDVTYTAVYDTQVNKYSVSVAVNDDSFGKVNITRVAYVPYGSAITSDGDTVLVNGVAITAIPSSTTAQYSYAFVDWTNAEGTVEGNVTITANFERTVNTYTIKWVNYDGFVIKSEELEYGATPVYEGRTPRRESDGSYTYKFTAWLPAVTPVLKDATYVANFESSVENHNYTVTIVSNNDEWGTVDVAVVKKVQEGSLILSQKDKITIKDTVVTATPTESDAQYTYTFVGWTYDSIVSQNLVVTANFERTVNTYTVSLVSDNEEYGTVSVDKVEGVPYGTVLSVKAAKATINGTAIEATPSAKTAQYTYAYSSWTNGTATVKGDITITAKFTRTVNKYTVTWKNYDGTVLETDSNVTYGTTPKFDGTTPVRPTTAKYTFTFDAWTPEVVDVTGDAEYKATFKMAVNTYKVTWKNWDGTVLEEDTNVAYGTIPSYNGETPTKVSSVQYHYTFVGWTLAATEVDGNQVYVALYSNTLRKYAITFNNWDDSKLETVEWEYGTTPKFGGDTPVKDQGDEYVYEFIGWDEEIEEVSGEKTYTAVYILTSYKLSSGYYITATDNTHFEVLSDVVTILAEDVEKSSGYVTYYTDKLPAGSKVEIDVVFEGTWDSDNRAGMFGYGIDINGKKITSGSLGTPGDGKPQWLNSWYWGTGRHSNESAGWWNDGSFTIVENIPEDAYGVTFWIQFGDDVENASWTINEIRTSVYDAHALNNTYNFDDSSEVSVFSNKSNASFSVTDGYLKVKSANGTTKDARIQLNTGLLKAGSKVELDVVFDGTYDSSNRAGFFGYGINLDKNTINSSMGTLGDPNATNQYQWVKDWYWGTGHHSGEPNVEQWWNNGHFTLTEWILEDAYGVEFWIQFGNDAANSCWRINSLKITAFEPNDVLTEYDFSDYEQLATFNCVSNANTYMSIDDGYIAIVPFDGSVQNAEVVLNTGYLKAGSQVEIIVEYEGTWTADRRAGIFGYGQSVHGSRMTKGPLGTPGDGQPQDLNNWYWGTGRHSNEASGWWNGGSFTITEKVLEDCNGINLFIQFGSSDGIWKIKGIKITQA